MTIPNKINSLTLKQLIQFNEPEGVLDTLDINKILKFGTVNWIKKREGIYTPANDLFPLLSADLGPSETANLIMLFVEGGSHANFVYFNRNDDFGAYMAVKGVHIQLCPNGSGTDRPKQFFFDGTAVTQNPMTQGVPVTYCLVIASVTLL